MDILGVSGVIYGYVSPLVQNTNGTVVPVNVNDPLFVNPKEAVGSNATNSTISPTIPNINGTVAPDNVKAIVQSSAPVNANDIQTETPVQVTLPAQNTNVTTGPDTAEVVRTIATLPSAAHPTTVANPVSLLQNTTTATVPVTAEAEVPPPPTAVTQAAVSNPATGNVVPPVVSEVIVPDTTLAAVTDIIPPITAFNITAGETMEINPAPVEDTSGIGNHGEVEAIMPPQPAFNNAAAESTEAKFKNNATISNVPSTGKRPRDYLRTINKRAQVTDLAFKRQHLPYRFEVLADSEENIYIDLSILDEKGKVIKHEKRDVTNDSFGRLMEDISSGKGLLIDDLPA